MDINMHNLHPYIYIHVYVYLTVYRLINLSLDNIYNNLYLYYQ